MNFKILSFALFVCISTVYSYTLGDSDEYIPDDSSPRIARQVCNNCVVGPPSTGYNNRRPYTNNRVTSRPTQRNSYNRGYSTSSRSSYSASSYNSRGGNNNNRGYTTGYQQQNNGCRCFGNTCFDCSIGK